MPEPFELLDLHVAAFNHAVQTDDWDALVEGFTPDGELVFVGVPAGPFTGRDAIAQAYRERPPDDEISILGASAVGGEIVAAYSWRRADGRKAGLLVLTPHEAKLRRLVVTFDPH
jgi:limonene-1,2-epoxide hydrolase